MNTIVWYDYETFGINPAFDRPAQFAAIRTDEDLNEIEEPVEIFCKPSDDFLPHPQAVLITGITPQQCQRQGVTEYEFMRRINDMFSVANTCVAGYNSIRFDDEVTRYGLYRNFFDPYAREWQNGNSRWDLLDIARCVYALRPEGINWPKNEEGKPSFKLEHLTAANGLDHGKAHDAVSDVRATIALAKLIKDKQPKLFDYFYDLRTKESVRDLINVAKHTPLVHVSGKIPAERGCMTVVVPLCWHPTNKNSVIVWDLQQDPADLYQLTAEQIQARVFTRAADLPEGVERLPLKEIHINKAPVIAPMNVLTPEQAERWQISGDALRNHLAFIRENAGLTVKMHEVFSGNEFAKEADVDGQLYDGFFGPADKKLMQEIHQLPPFDLADWTASFKDPRGEEMLFRFRARNYPDTLNEDEQERWEQHRIMRLVESNHPKILNFNQFAQELQLAAEQVADDPVKLEWIHELQIYAESIYPYI